jgi:hypothetical protein
VIHILVLFLLFGSFLPNEISCSRTFFSVHRILLSLIFLLFFTSFSLILNYFFNLILNNEKIVKIFNLIFLILNFILYFSIITFLIIIFIFKDDDHLFKLLTQILGLFVGCKNKISFYSLVFSFLLVIGFILTWYLMRKKLYDSMFYSESSIVSTYKKLSYLSFTVGFGFLIVSFILFLYYFLDEIVRLYLNILLYFLYTMISFSINFLIIDFKHLLSCSFK